MLTAITLIAHFWTPHTPFWATYALTYIGDLTFLVLLMNPTIKFKSESMNISTVVPPKNAGK